MAPNLQGLTPAITRRLQGGTSHDGPVPSRTDAGISLGNSAKKEVTAKKAMPKKHVPPKKGHLPPWLQPGFQKK